MLTKKNVLQNFGKAFEFRINALPETTNFHALESYLRLKKNLLKCTLKDSQKSDFNRMIFFIENTIISSLEGTYSESDFKYFFNKSIDSIPISWEIHPQSGWKKFIDDIANKIYNSFKNETSSLKRFSLFSQTMQSEEIKKAGDVFSDLHFSRP